MSVKARAFLTRWVKFTILIIGILLAVFGWYLDRAEQREWVIRIFARDYNQALNTYERMLDGESTIGPTDPGFAEIASILSEKLTGPGDLTISRITIKKESLWTFNTDGYGGPTIALVITLRDGRTVTAKSVRDLRPEIRERFLEQALSLRGERIFLIGIAISLITILHEFFGPGGS